MKTKKKYVITVFFLAIIYLFMISVIVRALTAETENKSKLSAMREAASESMTDNIFAKQPLLEFNGFISKICGVKITVGENTVAEIGDGFLTYTYDYADTSYQAKQTLKFNDFLERRDTRFLMMIPPFKVDGKDEKIISSLNDRTNIIADEFISNVQSEVEIFDMRRSVEKHGKEYLEMFFKTDHHWKPETGLEFTAKAAEVLRDDFGFDMNPSVYDKENFDVRVLKDYFLGSQGRKVTKGYAHPEDISIITPKEHTDFSVNIPKTGLDISGDFETVFIDREQIDVIDYYNLSPYNAYMHGDKPYIHIKNNLSGDGKRVLILKDSYAAVMVPYLAMQLDEIDVIDLRYYDGNIREFIEKTAPDTVIMICHPASLMDKNLFRMG
ncbi:MAG: hypothetical protein J1F64_06090 [Oscillospiraceae bacterium]|nr:hypothetical protein [Oscillospiraceae bacterium]